MRVLQVASQGASLFVTAITPASLAAARLFAIILEASNLCQRLKAHSQELYAKYLLNIVLYLCIKILD
jgi:hypothetical protein